MAQIALKSDSEKVRDYVRENSIKPAVRRGDRSVSVNVGAIHRALGLHNRVPLVCAALKSKKFLKQNGLRVLSVTGPPSGQSTTVTYTYEVVSKDAGRSTTSDPLIALRGIAKEVFKKLGGGEHFIRSERSKFYDRSQNSE
jgi:hypothetical protein